MVNEKRCENYEDFQLMYYNNIGPEKTPGNPVTKSNCKRIWMELTEGEDIFYIKNHYLVVAYDTNTKKYSRIKKTGRPKTIKSKSKLITLRLTDDEYNKLNNYCNTNNVDTSSAIRRSMENFFKQ